MQFLKAPVWEPFFRLGILSLKVSPKAPKSLPIHSRLRIEEGSDERSIQIEKRYRLD